jgi:NAD(P)-dependent dehydrogenase (short-subunit alcohol dehydrogenase family)
MTNFRDKVALVTGASSGIGRATVVRLAQLGCHVAVAGRKADTLEVVAAECRAGGVRAAPVVVDVGRAEDCRRGVEQAVAELGRLDIVVNSAGLSMRAYFDGSSLEAMERVVRVNFLGTLYMTHFALPHVKASRGSLVAISSLVGKRATPTYAAYGASKFAIQGLYEALHIELKPLGVHVGVMSPAFVATPLRDNALGPDGQPRPERPPKTFRIWPVEKCVERIVNLIVKRKREALLPAFVAPFLILDQILDRRLGDRILARRFAMEP